MSLGHVLNQGLETFSVKGQTVNALGFAFQRVSDAISMKAAINVKEDKSKRKSMVVFQ